MVYPKNRLLAPVICVGNASIGGTGKTQVVIWLAEQLLQIGLKPVVICKGYGGSFKEPMVVKQDMNPTLVGDEAVELSEKITTIAAKNPVDAKHLLDALSPDVIIVDDGMQNPRFIKDFIIMVVDSNRGFGNQMLFPAGPLRQSLQSAIDVSDAIISMGISSTNSEIQDNKWYKATISPRSLPDINEKYYAFAGIGNPQRFFEFCKMNLKNLVKTQAFPDHHKYSENEILNLKKNASNVGAKLITTQKDYVKLKHHPDIMPLSVTLKIDNGPSLIESIIKCIK